MTDTNPTQNQDDEALLTGHDDAPVSIALATAARMMRTRTAALLAEEGLFAGQDVLLLALGGEKSLEVGEIADRLGVRAPTVSKTLTRLAEAGLVSRSAVAGDKRRVAAKLTAKGRAKLDRIAEISIPRRARAPRRLRRQGRAALAQALAQGHPNDLAQRARRGGRRARRRRCRTALRPILG